MPAQTVNEVRLTNRIAWTEVWEKIEPGYKGVRRSRRKVIPDKHVLMKASKSPGALHWLVEAALLEAMCRVTEGLQTHIEDFVPTTQPVARQHP